MKRGEHRAAFLTARWTLIATTVCDWLFSPKVSNTVPDFHVNKQDQCEQWPQKGTVKAGSNCWMCTCAWLLKAVHRNAYQGNSHLGEGDANSLHLNQWSTSKETDQLLSLTAFPSIQTPQVKASVVTFSYTWSMLSVSLWEASSPGRLQVTSLGLTHINSLQMKT